MYTVIFAAIAVVFCHNDSVARSPRARHNVNCTIRHRAVSSEARRWAAAETEVRSEEARQDLLSGQLRSVRDEIEGLAGDAPRRPLAEARAGAERSAAAAVRAIRHLPGRVISDCHFAAQLDHLTPDSLSYSVAVFLK
jgi:hypothetical protein